MAEQQDASGAATLGDIGRAVWRTRKAVLLVLLAFTLLFWLVAVIFGQHQGRVYTRSAEVQFMFAGVEHGRYPDGTPFTSADLISRAVLDRVFEANNLAEHGLDPDRFAGMLAVAPDISRRDEIVQRYIGRLDSDLSAAEIGEVEREFQMALDRAAHGRVRVIFTASNDDLPGRDILADIPRYWAEYVLENAGVFATDLALYSVDVIEQSPATEMDFLLAYDALKEKFALLRHNVDVLEEQPNSGQVRDPETRLRLSDIRALGNELEEFVLEEALSPTMALGLSSEPELTVRFFANRVEDLQRRGDLMESKAGRVEAALQDYSGQSSALGVAQEGQPASGFGAEFGSDFLDRLVQLGAESGDLEFRQELSRDRLDYTLEAAALQSEVERLQRLIRLIERADEPVPGDGVVDDGMEEELETQVADITDSLKGLIAATGRIARYMDTLRYGSDEKLYTLGEISDVHASGVVLTRANLRWYLLGLLIVAILAVAALTVLSAPRFAGIRKTPVEQ